MSYHKKVTLKDIANDSGVSVSSVSMILNKREGVSFSRDPDQQAVGGAQRLHVKLAAGVFHAGSGQGENL